MTASSRVGDAPARPRRTRAPRGRRWRRPRTAGRARGSRAGAPGPSSCGRPSSSRRPIATVAISAIGRRSAGRAAPAGRGPAAPSSARSARRADAARRPGSKGARMTPSSVTIPVMSSAGVTSKAGLRTSVPAGAMRTPRMTRTSSALRSSIGMAAPSGVVEVDRARRGRDVERDAVAGRQDGQRVRADLVGRVAVGGDPVRPDDDDVDLAAGHEVAGRDVGDQRVRHAGLGQLPGRQPGALQVRPGLVDPDMERRPAWWAAWTTPSAVPNWPQASGPVLQWVRIRSGPSPGTGSAARPNVGQPAVVGRRLEDDGVGLRAHARRRSPRRPRTGRRALRSGPSSGRPPSAG